METLDAPTCGSRYSVCEPMMRGRARDPIGFAGADSYRVEWKRDEQASLPLKEMVRSMDKKEDLGSRANLLIMDTATQGETECRGPLAWSWKIVGPYVVAYIENLGTHADHFRVFRCTGRGYYERKLLLTPSYMADEYTCIYDAVENSKGREILHSTAEEWLDYVAKATDG